MTVGLVYYIDDPDKKVFRIVYPNYVLGDTDAVLDDSQWITLGVDKTRGATLVKVLDDDPRVSTQMLGTPWAAPTLNSVQVAPLPVPVV